MFFVKVEKWKITQTRMWLTCMSVYSHTYICVRVFMYICICIYTCMYVCIFVCTFLTLFLVQNLFTIQHECWSFFTYITIYVCLYTHIYICVCVFMHICICIYACMYVLCVRTLLTLFFVQNLFTIQHEMLVTFFCTWFLTKDIIKQSNTHTGKSLSKEHCNPAYRSITHVGYM